MKKVEFNCPECDSPRLEEVMINVTVASNCDEIYIGNGEVSIIYCEQSNEDGEIQSYQCMGCGHVVANSQEELVTFFEDQKEDQEEQQRRDEKRGLYPDKEDIAN
jgi:DNA-directed RNA polymerase subunit RPC12/RpoP